MGRFPSYRQACSKKSIYIGALALCYFLFAGLALAENSSLESLLQEIREDRDLDRTLSQEREARFLEDRDWRRELLNTIERELQKEQGRNSRLSEKYENNEILLSDAQAKLNQEKGALNQLLVTASQVLSDTRNVLNASIVSAEYPDRVNHLSEIESAGRIMTSDDIEHLWITMMEEMVRSSEVSRFESDIISASGQLFKGDVTRIGAFTAITEGRYLRYLPESKQLMTASDQPSGRYAAMAESVNVLEGGVVTAPVDPSKGAILHLLAQQPDLLEHLGHGGWIGMLILALGGLGILVIGERFIVLRLTLSKLKRQQKSKTLSEKNPLGRILASVSEVVDIKKVSGAIEKDAESSLNSAEGSLNSAEGSSPEALVLRLEEATKKEIPSLKRGLNLLVVLSTVTPLLGLLGTVTGMITTFQAITLFGTGDPKLMSGGISQALVTTELGLAVAIPIILLHGVVANKAKKIIAILDQECTALVAKTVEAAKP